MKDKILVSVCCMAYNHEKYISECLDGFVKQKTDFAFEVLVHDDASTDRTQEIIRQYAEKYPNIIKPIIQTENQYSKKRDIVGEFLAPIVRGQFVAICEGDDFWTSENKLQKQVDVLLSNSEINMCVHATKEIFEDGTATGIVYPADHVKEGKIATETVYSLPYSFHTSSYLFRATVWKEYITNPPKFRKVCDVGDEPDLLFFGCDDGIYFVKDEMSCYRRGVPGSWSSMQAKIINVEKMARHANAMVETYQTFDEFTDKKYHSLMVKKIAKSLLQAVTLTKKARTLLKRKNKEYFKCLKITKKVFVLLATIFPRCSQKWYIGRIKKLYRKNGY